jgi:formylglycine-generating enzyme required for sulfatase activity
MPRRLAQEQNQLMKTLWSAQIVLTSMKPSKPAIKTAGEQPLRVRCIHTLIFLGLLAVLTSASAQTPAGLTLRLHAGLSITGAVGTVYSIEYATDLGQTNAPTDWRCLEFLQLPASPHFWADKSAPATGRRFYRAVVFNAPTNLVFIPPGSFRMGSPTNEVDRLVVEGPQTAVTISRGFWIGKYEVTQWEYLAVIGSNPSRFTSKNGYTEDLTRPVESVSWFDATGYCALLTARERAAGRIVTNTTYRLPTEAEWEYAYRAWTSTRFSYGDDPGYTNLTDYAWYNANSSPPTHPVGQKLANPWGLHDMSGNVWELVNDWRSAEYSGGIVVDPQGPTTGTLKRARGGSFAYDASRCRAAFRAGVPPDLPDANIGFRVVLAASE